MLNILCIIICIILFSQMNVLWKTSAMIITKRIVHPKTKILSSFTHSRCYKPVWPCFFFATKKKILHTVLVPLFHTNEGEPEHLSFKNTIKYLNICPYDYINVLRSYMLDMCYKQTRTYVSFILPSSKFISAASRSMIHWVWNWEQISPIINKSFRRYKRMICSLFVASLVNLMEGGC